MDCCYSGQIHAIMSDFNSNLSSQINIKDAKGTYLMTSTDQDTPARYDDTKLELATYFTAKLIETLEEGISP